jgi:hypothetical protein
MTNQDKTNKAVNLVKKFCPGFNTINKSNSKLHKIIGYFLGKIGNKDYMESYITTIGSTVAVPTIYEDTDKLWLTILHEGQHAKDSNSLGSLLFSVCYLFPQILALLGLLVFIGVLLATGSLQSLWILTSLLFLLPIPSFGRAYIELRGYTVTLAGYFWANSITDEELFIDSIIKQFTGPAYYFMWPFKCFLKSYFQLKLTELKTNTFVLDSYLAACKVLCKEVIR